ncbi:MAG TPA: PAAR-like domain-containing protein [Polyangia bacterium]
MPSVSINPPKTPVTKGSNTLAVATVPNVCKMPGPPAPFVPVPLPNIGKSALSPSGYSTSVKIEGNAVAIRGATFNSIGDIASKGTGGGLISANTHGITKFIGPGSLDVQIEGKNVQLLGDPMLNNCGGPPNAATMVGAMHAPNVVLPVLVFSAAEFPEKTANMKKFLKKKNSMTLTRQTNRRKIRANRRAACGHVTPGGAGTSIDEFPFASSKEGGAGAAATPIDENEQNKQGGKLSGFYKKNKINNNSKYKVMIGP